MNTIVSFFSSPAAQAIARTVLHSFWQSAAVLVLLLFVLRLTPGLNSKARYFLAYSSIILLLFTCVYTFMDHRAEPVTIKTAGEWGTSKDSPRMSFTSADGRNTFTNQAEAWIALVAPYVTMVWTIGVFLFLFRLSGSWWYLYSLRKNVQKVTGDLADRLNELATRMDLRRHVVLAESARVGVPMVIGCLKPMLLIPVGFVSGLSTAQVEAIFIHELTHIRREDYLLNLIQSIAEALLFYNPFAWIISSIIRREREHCCDDAVIQSGGNAFEYVRALTLLEENRITQSTLALSAIGTQNELLHRIKRIMEKSVTKNSFREKLVPGLLLIIGIVCASWVTISHRESTPVNYPAHNEIETDTTGKKKIRATHSKNNTVSKDAEDLTRYNTSESHPADDWQPLVAAMDLSYNFPIPTVPDVPAFDFTVPPPADLFTFYADSIPPRSPHDIAQWKDFQTQFEHRFKEQFGDFYTRNQDKIAGILEEMEPRFQARFSDSFVMSMEDMAQLHEDNARLHEEHMRMSEDAMREQETHLRDLETQMKNWEAQNAEHMKKVEQEMAAFEEKMKAFEKELIENLRKDGYLKDNDRVRAMHWQGGGEIEINGMKIKPEHATKYRELHQKYFDGEPHDFRYEN